MLEHDITITIIISDVFKEKLIMQLSRLGSTFDLNKLEQQGANVQIKITLTPRLAVQCANFVGKYLPEAVILVD